MSNFSELDAFRRRIENWSRVYRDRFVRQETWLYKAIREKNPAEYASEEPVAVDEKDADFLESCFKSLNGWHRKILYTVYLSPRLSITYECWADRRKAVRIQSRHLGIFHTEYDREVADAEAQFMRIVQSREEALERKREYLGVDTEED